MSSPALVNARPITPGQLGRIAQFFWAPVHLFQEIPLARSWWLPFVITTLCSLSLTVSSVYRIGFHQLTVNMVRSDPANAESFDRMSPEQKESALGTAETVFEVSTYSTPVLVILYNALYALVLWGGINVLAGGRADFGSIFTVLLYADLVQGLKAILSATILWANPNDLNSTFNLQNPIGSNIGYYLDPTYQGWSRTLLESVDVFTIWYLVMIALGCAIVGKIKKGTSIKLVFGVWFFIVVGRVLWTAIG